MEQEVTANPFKFTVRAGRRVFNRMGDFKRFFCSGEAAIVIAYLLMIFAILRDLRSNYTGAVSDFAGAIFFLLAGWYEQWRERNH